MGTYTRKASAAIQKLTGIFKKMAAAIPIHTYIRLKSTAMLTAIIGRENNRTATAAGPTNSVKINSTPTTSTEMETVAATRHKKRTLRRVTGTPRASAISESKEIKR